MMSANSSSGRPIVGVFDSGVGGLTVLRELLRQAPQTEYLYFGDTARLPYGSKSVETVSRYAISSAQFLVEHGAEFLVIACNTASALALDAIAAAVPVPVLGVIDPGAARAAEISRSRKVVVIATEGTVGSHAYRRSLDRLGITALEKACPLLVPLVEEGWTDHAVTEQVAHLYLDPVFGSPDAAGSDVLVLGCTHYPLLRGLLRRVAPAHVQIVDSAECIPARVIAHSARFRKLVKVEGGGSPAAGFRLFATDSVEKFRRAGEKFLGRPIAEVTHVDIES